MIWYDIIYTVSVLFYQSVVRMRKKNKKQKLFKLIFFLKEFWNFIFLHFIFLLNTKQRRFGKSIYLLCMISFDVLILLYLNSYNFIAVVVIYKYKYTLISRAFNFYAFFLVFKKTISSLKQATKNKRSV